MENIIFKCKFCERVFSSKNACNSHSGKCKQNPNAKRTEPSEKWHEAMKKIDRSKLANQSKKEFECPFCNKKWITTKSGFSIHTKYCKLNPNRADSASLSHTWSDESRKKLSETRKKYIKDHGGIWWSSRSNCKRSYAEEWILKILKNEVKDQDFIEEYHLNRWFMDFAWPKKQIYIEIDGDQHSWEARKRSDEEKDAFYNSIGWKVLRLPWRYCYNNTQEAIKNIIDFVDNAKIININWVDPKIKKEKEKQERKQEYIEQHKINIRGITNPNMLSFEEWEKRKEIILNSNVDMMKFGWVSKMEKATGFSKRIIENVLLKFPEVFEGKYFRRK